MRKCRLHFFQCAGRWTPRAVETIRELASLPCPACVKLVEVRRKKADHRATRTHAVRQLPLSPCHHGRKPVPRRYHIGIQPALRKVRTASFPTHRCDHGASKIKDPPPLPARRRRGSVPDGGDRYGSGVGTSEISSSWIFPEAATSKDGGKETTDAPRRLTDKRRYSYPRSGRVMSRASRMTMVRFRILELGLEAP